MFKHVFSLLFFFQDSLEVRRSKIAIGELEKSSGREFLLHSNDARVNAINLSVTILGRGILLHSGDTKRYTCINT